MPGVAQISALVAVLLIESSVTGCRRFGGLGFLESAPCKHQCDVIGLFALTELLHRRHDDFEQRGDR